LETSSLGIDLAGVKNRPTGICLLKENLEAQLDIAYQDQEIFEAAENFKPAIIGIDAPLSFPKTGGLRECDRKLIKMKIRVLPPVLGGMRKLTLRAIQLKEKFESRNLKVVECFPGAVRKILKLPDKNASSEAAVKALKRISVKIRKSTPSKHEVDAALVALTAKLYLEGLAEPVGNQEGQIVIPKPEALKWLTRKL
jgi:hypothetical protein